MYATRGRYLVGAGAIDALTSRLDDELAAALGQQPGFVCFFAIRTDDATVETLSVFDDRQSAELAGELATAHARERVGDLVLSYETVTGGYVILSRAVPERLAGGRRRSSELADAMLAPAADVSTLPVLVVGATGRTGRLIVERLHRRGLTVHALVRDAAKGREVLPPDVRQFVGNARTSHTLIAPMTGVGAVIIATAGGSEQENTAELVDYFGTLNLVRQAVASHAGLIVFISTLGATRPAHSMDVEPTSLGWKARAEEIIRGSGVPYCIVRAGWLTDGVGGEPIVVTQGDITDGRISRTDLAEVCTQLLFLPSAYGKTIDVVAARDGTPGNIEAAIAAATADTTPEPHRAAGTPAIR